MCTCPASCLLCSPPPGTMLLGEEVHTVCPLCLMKVMARRQKLALLG